MSVIVNVLPLIRLNELSQFDPAIIAGEFPAKQKKEVIERELMNDVHDRTYGKP